MKLLLAFIGFSLQCNPILTIGKRFVLDNPSENVYNKFVRYKALLLQNDGRSKVSDFERMIYEL